jgi:hypothetical protein
MKGNVKRKNLPIGSMPIFFGGIHSALGYRSLGEFEQEKA